ncbi:DUF2334 domain-containing protein [Nocardia niigatensis]
MGPVAIRLDDIHAGMPLAVLRMLDREVWRGRPVTLGVIPYPARYCLGPDASRHESLGSRSSASDPTLVAYLDMAVRNGGEAALHGLTHADHKSADGPAVPELLEVSAGREELLKRTLDAWRDRFATKVLIPPHNVIDHGLASRITRRGYLISRSIRDDEVARLGFDPHADGARAAAKRQPREAICALAETFQTIGLSRRYILRNHKTPADTARELVHAAKSAGNATVTFHWWDFASPSDSLMFAYAAETLDLVSQSTAFATICDLP